MAAFKAVMFSALICLSNAINLKFPAHFKFGASTSAYQIEGAWNVSDKGNSIWDRFTHAYPEAIRDRSTGDVACDSYHLWRRDIEMAEELGLDFYRFSISWGRLLPNGFTNFISENGKNYYNNLIDGLLEKGIEPVVTLYHFELPQRLQNLGGWMNPLISDWFAEYARVVYSLYADRVKTWITINEPLIICDFALGTGTNAPGLEDPKIAPYLCNKHILLAHAKAWRLYDNEFKSEYYGKVSISNQLTWVQPYSPKDVYLTELVNEYMLSRYSHPIYSNDGGWPPVLERILKELSIKEGYSCSRLPPFTNDEIQMIQGTYDFLAINYYTSRLVRRARSGEVISSNIFAGIIDLKAVLETDPSWLSEGGYNILPAYPEGFRKQLTWLKDNYGDIEILITENGFAMNTTISNLHDENRMSYIQIHLEQILLSMKLDGVNVVGYTYWSLMDNFEWAQGYMAKFGLYEVDFSSPLRTRTPRSSALYYKNIIQSRTLQVPRGLKRGQKNYIKSSVGVRSN